MLFLADDDRVAAAAAVGHWCATRTLGTSEPNGDAWRTAILRTSLDQAGHSQSMAYWLGEILSGDGALAADWLTVEFHRRQTWFRREKVTAKAVQALTADQRRTVLRELPTSPRLAPRAIARLLVGEDLDLYRELLASDELRSYHLSPLAGEPDLQWSERATLALDATYTLDEVVAATWASGRDSVIWSGDSESESWATRRRAFEALRAVAGEDLRVVRLARRGEELTHQQEEEAKQRDRERAVDVPW